VLLAAGHASRWVFPNARKHGQSLNVRPAPLQEACHAKAGSSALHCPETEQLRRPRGAVGNQDARMIPISDDNPGRTTPIVTWAIIAACVIVYLWERSLGHEMDRAIDALGFKPNGLFGHHHVIDSYIAVPAITAIFVSMFLHGSILHIAGNMLYLWIFGNNVEDAMGHFRFLLFYFVCGVAAALALAWIDPGSKIPMIGASGAISGVLAGYVLLFPRARVTVIVPLGIIFFPLAVSAFWVVGFWFLLQLISAAITDPGQPGVAWWAHVGGFAAGLVLTPILKSSSYPLFGPVRRGPWNR
jgi:membrane associated rhomboid family serine protease